MKNILHKMRELPHLQINGAIIQKLKLDRARFNYKLMKSTLQKMRGSLPGLDNLDMLVRNQLEKMLLKCNFMKKNTLHKMKKLPHLQISLVIIKHLFRASRINNNLRKSTLQKMREFLRNLDNLDMLVRNQ